MNAFQQQSYTEHLNRNSSEYVFSINDLTGEYSGILMNILRTSSDVIVGLFIVGLLAWTDWKSLTLILLLHLSYLFMTKYLEKAYVYGHLVNQTKINSRFKALMVLKK